MTEMQIALIRLITQDKYTLQSFANFPLFSRSLRDFWGRRYNRLKCNTRATELIVDKSLNVVKGIKYRSKQNIGSPSFDMYGDFIIDCTGRYTSSPNWLNENFNLIVPTIQIHFGCSYVTFIGERFRIGDSSFDSALVISNPVDSPEKNVGFIVIPIRTIKTNNENSLGTSSTIAINCVNSEYPPNDSYENLLEWTKENLDPKYYTILKAAKVCSPLIPSRHAIDDRKYVESLGKKWPQNYILLGDSMCSFNPQYAQVISEECWFASTTNDWKTPTLKVIETDKYGQVKTYQRDGNSTSTNNPEPRIPIMIRFMQWLRVPRVRNHPHAVLHHLNHVPHWEERTVDSVLAENIGEGTKDNPFVIYRDAHSMGTGSHQRLRFVCVSDTHNQIDRLIIPHGDVFVHCGDAVNYMTCTRDLINFNKFVGTLPHTHKLFISGNHCVSLNPKRPDLTQKILSNMTYIQDQVIDIEGVQIYGSSWHPKRGILYRSNAFGYHHKKIRADKWTQIPENIDILLTHSPPYSIRDYNPLNAKHMGCPGLLDEIVTRVKPRIHLFGHIHDDHGASLYISEDNQALAEGNSISSSHDILFVNLAIDHGQRLGKPVVIDYFY
ncbi:unnamed protein product [Rotaria sp. Silwood1]|nr:unnamed protein product [Rotaria sp. Silwood1]